MEFQENNVDILIRHWRNMKDTANNDEDVFMARCYIDAYQTMRVNHGLCLLEAE